MKHLKYIIAIFIISIHFLNADQSLQCGDWDPFKDEKCFKILDKKEFKNYSDANIACYQNDGSSLVTIRSQEEQDFVYNLLHNVHQLVNDVWIGAQYIEQVFRWTDITAVNITNWANNYPKNDTRYECIQMSMDAAFPGKWFNEPCDKLNVVVCQKEQNWLFSYLQKTVKDLRESYENLTKHFEITRYELDYTKNELKNTKTDFESTKTELKNTKTDLESTKTELKITKTDLESTKILLNQVSNKATDASPVGTIVFYSSDNPPSGWLKANGQQVSRTTYAALFSIIGATFGSSSGNTTFTLPDLRGEFIRGWSESRDVDTNRAFGSFQWGSSIPMAGHINDSNYAAATAFQDHWNFAGSTFDNGFENNVPIGQTRDGVLYPNDWQNEMYYTEAPHKGSITSWIALKGTRPRNVALLACIKY